MKQTMRIIVNGTLAVLVGVIYTNLLCRYFGNNLILSNNIVANPYRWYGLMSALVMMVFIKLCDNKKERLWQYVFSMIVLGVSCWCVWKYSPCFHTGLDRKDAILVKTLYPMYVPIFLVLVLSLALEFLSMHQQFIKYACYLFYGLMIVIQIDAIQNISQYASSTPDFSAIFSNYQFIRNILMVEAILISLSMSLKMSFDKHMMKMLFVIVFGFTFVCLIGNIMLHLDVKGIRYHLLLCRLIPFISIIVTTCMTSFSKRKIR